MLSIRAFSSHIARSQAHAWRSIATTSGSHATNSKVGFIGLGNMGGPMAENLINKGHGVSVFDVSEEAAGRLGSLGAQVCSSPAAVAEGCDRIVSMLPNSRHVQDVYAGANGILSTVQPGTLMIDSSTIDPAVSQEMALAADAKSAVYMDAPVSGGVNAARGGTLTFMVGGPDGKFAAARQLLECMGQNIVHCGAVGSGQAAKICNNMMLAVSMIGAAETMNLGTRLGLDPKLLAKILATSTGRCWAIDSYNPVPGIMENVPSSNDYKGGFGTALMCKDLGLAQASATASEACTPLGSAAHQIYRLLVNQGHGHLDFSAVYKYISEHR
ncbi:3-hydroxyisobutyrate dehydrogenase, mitochondrial-like isoform X2 [Pollicipes pollicipes]|nr:3-hydroxyisobutyrate dehydrogenase, mitochondrial-like isoform X2 [Pollicipes pollicipes]XP_037078042.1 3-hydroxyisobutyrate dehydrogenase, mitochondrial-like isoform X2 [Pollicipes pollicipes]XP_037078043.1 3-hydroxyisobutyrate dehydrogenase, mitochondrial-like isoform X2 [Pollicipes pollicipes]XP_037078044.1 3-hydroxyisobutyrate dehydrogenase, mitochondrial-like isoform X2 [Pollicipes pollicipes]